MKIRVIKELDKVLLEVLKLSAEVLKLKYNYIYYFDSEKNKYRLYDLEGKKDEFLDREHSLIKYARKNKDVFYFKKISDDYHYELSLKNEYRDIDLNELYELLRKQRAEFCLPFVINNEFTGVWVVGEKLNKRTISPEEIRWIMNLCFQIGLVVENIILFEELLRSQKFATLGKMSAAVAHEIRNPISGLYSFIQMILNQKDERAVNKFFDIASDEFKRIERLTTNLLSLGHATKLKKENASINELITNTCEILNVNFKKSRINLIEKFEKLPVIMVDREMIKQVLLNLILNAIQAMPDGGNLEIGTKIENESVLIYIKDEGIGIDDKIKDRIYEPFYSTKADGSGIGLTLAKNIIELHGGSIYFESTKNTGTTFYIKLPAKE
jgi:signal transduction histidine kinase